MLATTQVAGKTKKRKKTRLVQLSIYSLAIFRCVVVTVP